MSCDSQKNKKELRLVKPPSETAESDPNVIAMRLQTLHFDDSLRSGSSTQLKYEISGEKARIELEELQKVREKNRKKQTSNESKSVTSESRQNLRFVYNYTVINKPTGSPKRLTQLMCSQFVIGQSEVNSTSKAVTNTFLVASDDWDTYKRDRDRMLEYAIHTLSTLGIPVFTWLPDRVGEFEMEEDTLAIRLEPMRWHMAQAHADFLQTYSWNMVALVISNRVPAYQNIEKELRGVKRERSHPDHPKYFEFQITKTVYFDGFHTTEISEKVREPAWSQLAKNFTDVLRQLYESGDRVMIFHGNANEMVFLLRVVANLKGVERKYAQLFTRDYVWICNAGFQTPFPGAIDRMTMVSPDNHKITDSAGSREDSFKVPGMFAFVVMNDMGTFQAKTKLARYIWQKAVTKLFNELIAETHNVSDVMSKLLPRNVCDGTHPFWNKGARLRKTILDLKFKYGDEYIGFLQNGGVNTSEMFIFNSKVEKGLMNWVKVGTWSMSSRFGSQKSKLRIDGVIWPGNANQPPKGRPDKFKLKVATLKERPFVIYTRMPESGACDSNSILCHVHRDSLDAETLPLTEVTEDPRMSSHFSSLGKILATIPPMANKVIQSFTGPITLSQTTFRPNSTLESTNPYANLVKACCAGLTMDLLLELMKDLNFEVDLFEVEDKRWGGWTNKGWNGLVRVLMEKKADMVVTSLKITPNRSSVIDFSVPFLETGISIIVALREGAISPTAFLEPYDFLSWLMILVFSVHATAGALFIYEWLSPYGLDRGNLLSRDHRFSLFRSLWLIWSMLFGAAVNADNPRGAASRFLGSIWALFALVFLASYTANLAAFMIAKEDYYKLEGMTDYRLVMPWKHKPPFRFATVPSGATEENIKNNFPDMFLYMSHYNKSSVELGIKALKQSELDAFLYDANVLEYMAAHDDGCKLRTVGNLYAMTGYGVAFPKKSRWLNKLNTMILEYQKNGKLQRWKAFWLAGACKKEASLGNSNKMLGVKNFISAFLLLVAGIILCCLLLLLEHAFYKYMRPKLRDLDTYGCCGLVSIRMGQLLSFEQSVNTTVDLLKHHKCSNAICEAQLWRARHDAQILQVRVSQLEASLYRKQQLLERCIREHHLFSSHRYNTTQVIKKSGATDSFTGSQSAEPLAITHLESFRPPPGEIIPSHRSRPNILTFRQSHLPDANYCPTLHDRRAIQSSLPLLAIPHSSTSETETQKSSFQPLQNSNSRKPVKVNSKEVLMSNQLSVTSNGSKDHPPSKQFTLYRHPLQKPQQKVAKSDQLSPMPIFPASLNRQWKRSNGEEEVERESCL